MHVKNFAAYGERGRKFLLFTDLIKPFSVYMPRESLRMWRKRGQNSCVHGECTNRLMAYSPNKPIDKKLSIIQLINVQNQKKKFRSFNSIQDGLD